MRPVEAARTDQEHHHVDNAMMKTMDVVKNLRAVCFVRAMTEDGCSDDEVVVVEMDDER